MEEGVQIRVKSFIGSIALFQELVGAEDQYCLSFHIACISKFTFQGVLKYLNMSIFNETFTTSFNTELFTPYLGFSYVNKTFKEEMNSKQSEKETVHISGKNTTFSPHPKLSGKSCYRCSSPYPHPSMSRC